MPHVYVARPWQGRQLAIGDQAERHLVKVLRLRAGDPVSYTDGEGTVGTGMWDGGISRGSESVEEPRSKKVTIASAVPRKQDRARFLVEKLSELGVSELLWLRTRRSAAQPPAPEKCAAWAVAALEQSRGAFLMGLSGPVDIADLPKAGKLFAAVPGGPALHAVANPGSQRRIIAIGPEAGFEPDEIPDIAVRFGMGPTILRVETAAISAAVVAMGISDAD